MGAIATSTTKVFLGGTVGNNNWRDQFTKTLIAGGVPAEVIFNPVVADWNEAAQAREDKAKAEAEYKIFYLANPLQEDLNISGYSIWETAVGLFTDIKRTLVVFDNSALDGHALKVMKKIEKDIRALFPDARIFSTPEQAAQYLASVLA